VVAGTTHDRSFNHEIGLVRYNVGVAGQADGSLDTTFGQGGIVTTPIPGATNADTSDVNALALEADGKIVVAVTDNNSAFLTARYNVGVAGRPDGSLDSTFGSGGLVMTSGNGANAIAVAIDPRNDPTNGGKIVVAGAFGGGLMMARYLPSEPEIGSFTASPNPVSAGSSVTLTASNITDGNPNSTIKQVAFYADSNSDGILDAGDTLLGYGTLTSGGWSFPSTVNLAPGTDTLFAQAEDSYGVFGDPLALQLHVL
jgi:hypothetical protein